MLQPPHTPRLLPTPSEPPSELSESLVFAASPHLHPGSCPRPRSHPRNRLSLRIPGSRRPHVLPVKPNSQLSGCAFFFFLSGQHQKNKSPKKGLQQKLLRPLEENYKTLSWAVKGGLHKGGRRAMWLNRKRRYAEKMPALPN